MTRQASELLQKALSLSDEERAELAGSLIESLDPTFDEAAEAAWNQEIARRINDQRSSRWWQSPTLDENPVIGNNASEPRAIFG